LRLFQTVSEDVFSETQGTGGHKKYRGPSEHIPKILPNKQILVKELVNTTYEACGYQMYIVVRGSGGRLY
jgi:hypothetical protein